MTKIFVDSNFFIALNNPSDSLYEKAVLKSREIKDEGVVVYISDYIILETVTVLSQRAGRKIATEAGKRLIESAEFKVVSMEFGLFQKTWATFQNILKKNMSFIDCSSLVIMESEGIRKFLTFDKEDFSGLRKAYNFSFY